jgi:hypothetical protein
MMNRIAPQIIHSGPRYQVGALFHGELAGGAQRGDAPVVVTFPHAGGPTDLDVYSGFAQTWLERERIDCIAVQRRKSDWFQVTEFHEVLDAIRAHLPAGRPVVTYGASMGGYGALLASGPLGAARVVAVTPQYSLEPDVVPFERRWRREAAEIGRFIHDIDRCISGSAHITVIFDPRIVDGRHVEMFEGSSRWDRIALPHAGHLPLVVLRQSGLLGRLILPCLLGHYDERPPLREILKARRQSALYFRTLGMTAARLGRQDVVRRAEHECRKLGDSAAADRLAELGRLAEGRARRRMPPRG